MNTRIGEQVLATSYGTPGFLVDIGRLERRKRESRMKKLNKKKNSKLRSFQRKLTVPKNLFGSLEINYFSRMDATQRIKIRTSPFSFFLFLLNCFVF